MLVFDLKSGLFKFCVVVWFVDQWYFSVPYMYFCQGESHWIPFFLLQTAKGLVPDKVVSRTMCKREYHCLLKGEIEHSSPPSLSLPHLIMCLDDAKSNWMQKMHWMLLLSLKIESSPSSRSVTVVFKWMIFLSIFIFHRHVDGTTFCITF